MNQAREKNTKKSKTELTLVISSLNTQRTLRSPRATFRGLEMNKHEFDFLDIPAPDRDLISSFVNAVQAWAPISLQRIILYGSVAKGVFPEVYDIDIAMLFSSDFDHPQFYAEIYRIITDLEPQRELHVVLKWEEEIEPAYQELIEKDGITLFP